MTFYDQLPAFIGVVVGAGMSFAATYWMDRTGWRRNHSIRWDERRLSAYLDYSNAVKDLVTIAGRLASNQPLESGMGPLDRTSENLDKLSAAEERRTVVSETLRLFADVVLQTATVQAGLWFVTSDDDSEHDQQLRFIPRMSHATRIRLNGRTTSCPSA